MNHEAYEKEMIDTVNRHSAEWDQLTFADEFPDTKKGSKHKGEDARTLRRGLKRMAIAILTAIVFLLTVFTYIAVATATGYAAVLLFFLGVVLTVVTYILLYAQGVTQVESKGGSK